MSDSDATYNEATAKKAASMMWAAYRAFIAEGFTADQAIELCKALMMSASGTAK